MLRFELRSIGLHATIRMERATVVARVYGRQNPATARLDGKVIPHFGFAQSGLLSGASAMQVRSQHRVEP